MQMTVAEYEMPIRDARVEMPIRYPHSNRLLMDRLSGDRQEMIKKCSSDRLRSKLVEAGYDSATVSKLDRTGLMETMAQLMMKQECFWAGF